VAAPRGVGVGELVHERHRGPAGQHGIEVHLVDRRPPVGHHPPRQDLQAVEQLGRVRSAVRLDEADDDVGAPLEAPVGLVEHRHGLADPGGGPEVDAQPAASHGDIVLTGRDGIRVCQVCVEFGDVHAVLPEEAERGALGVVGDHGQHLLERDSAGAGDARRLVRGVLGRDVRVQTTRGCRERVGRDAHGRVGVGSAQGGLPLGHGVGQGLRVRAEVGTPTGVTGVLGHRRSSLEPLRPLGGLAEQAGSDDLAVDLDEGSGRLVGQGDAHGEDRGGIDHPHEDGQHEQRLDRGEELAGDGHGYHLSPGRRETSRSMSLMPTNGAARPPRP